MQNLRVVLFTGLSVILASIVAFTWIAIWPYMHQIGLAVLIFFYVLLLCLSCLAIASTWHLIGILAARHHRDRLYSQVVTNGEVVAVVNGSGQVVSHLSAEHERAKLQIAGPFVEEDGSPVNNDASLILELRDQGLTLQSIMQATGATYHRVQSVCSAAKKG